MMYEYRHSSIDRSKTDEHYYEGVQIKFKRQLDGRLEPPEDDSWTGISIAVVVSLACVALAGLLGTALAVLIHELLVVFFLPN